ncbi:MAG: hypothetical protein H6873_12395 [Hyphomicrobiaceae bacterium]|nr:hypothetical protein [Hyphomicrobiaceae bacterium]
MNVKVSARFWGFESSILELARKFGNDLVLSRPIIKAGSENLYYTCTVDFEAENTLKSVDIVDDLYDRICSSHDALDLILEKKVSAEIWVVAFGEPCDLDGRISDALMSKIQNARVSLFVENYPLSGNKNPSGSYVVQFE